MAWNLQTPEIEKAEMIPYVTGGYVIGSFDVYYLSNPKVPVAHYRFVHQYNYTQAPEFHTFLLTGSEEAFVTNLYFGHSYGYPTPEELWSFEDLFTKKTEQFTLSKEPLEITLDWKGLLPYPKGEDITGRISDLEEGSSTLPGLPDPTSPSLKETQPLQICWCQVELKDQGISQYLESRNGLPSRA